jgi:hypothetical protein
MTSKTPHKFGLGGDYIPRNQSDGIPQAIRLFLKAVDHCVPQCLSELAKIGSAGDPAIRAWCQKRGFTSRTLRRIVADTVEWLREHPDSRPSWIFARHSYWMPDIAPLEHPVWNSVEEHESSFRNRVERYIEEVRANPAIAKAPTKRAARDRHFEWLALYQVAGLKLERIAERDRDGIDIGTISRAVTQTAALVGVDLRSVQGRSKKK